MLGDIELMNRETDIYEAVTSEALLAKGKEVFRKENCATLWYIAQKLES